MSNSSHYDLSTNKLSWTMVDLFDWMYLISQLWHTFKNPRTYRVMFWIKIMWNRHDNLRNTIRLDMCQKYFVQMYNSCIIVLVLGLGSLTRNHRTQSSFCHNSIDMVHHRMIPCVLDIVFEDCEMRLGMIIWLCFPSFDIGLGLSDIDIWSDAMITHCITHQQCSPKTTKRITYSRCMQILAISHSDIDHDMSKFGWHHPNLHTMTWFVDIDRSVQIDVLVSFYDSNLIMMELNKFFAMISDFFVGMIVSDYFISLITICVFEICSIWFILDSDTSTSLWIEHGSKIL